MAQRAFRPPPFQVGSTPDRGETYVCKTVLVGASASGAKSSLMARFVKRKFFDLKGPTIGAAYCTQTIASHAAGIGIKFDIWDTAGQERYRRLTTLYFRNAQCVVVGYDITDKASFHTAESWLKELPIMPVSSLVSVFGKGCVCSGREDTLPQQSVALSLAPFWWFYYFAGRASRRT